MRHRELALGSALKLKAEQDRKAAMGRVADGFEQAIGKIVQAVSSEIEVAAGNLNRTAEANNTLIVTRLLRFRSRIRKCAIGCRRIGADGFLGY